MVDFFAMYQNSRRINPFGFLKLKRATKTRNLINACCLVQSAKNIYFLNYLTSIDFLQNVLLLVLQVPLVRGLKLRQEFPWHPLLKSLCAHSELITANQYNPYSCVDSQKGARFIGPWKNYWS